MSIYFSKISYIVGDFWPYIFINFATIITCLLTGFKIFKKGISDKKKILTISLVIFIMLFVFAYSMFEAYFRYVYDEPDGLGFLKVSKKWNERHVVYNNYQFRDRNFEVNKAEDTTRIAVVGDSLTFGGGIENKDDRFSNILEKKLNESGSKVEVYNLGRPGFDTEGEIEVYKSLEHLNFDIVVWQYFLNDIQPPGQSTGTPIINTNSQKGKTIKALSDASFFFDFVYWRTSQRYQKTFSQLKNADLAQYQNQDLYKSHKESIKNFIEEENKKEIKVVFIIFPLINAIGPNYPATPVHDDLKNYIAENGAQAIDLLPLLKDRDAQTLIASKFDSHPNEVVHAIAAEELYKVLKPQIQ